MSNLHRADSIIYFLIFKAESKINWIIFTIRMNKQLLKFKEFIEATEEEECSCFS